jgi:peroxiredoxin
MKRISALIVLLIAAASCETASNKGFQISGTIAGDVADSTKVYLRKSDADLQPADSDSTTVVNGNFNFAGEIEEPQLHYIFIQGARGGIPLILEKGNVEIIAHKDSLFAAEVSGTPQNEAYSEFLEGSRQLVDKRNSINQEMRTAMAAQDTANMSSLRDEFFELQDEGINFEKTFVQSHPDALISALIINRMLQQQSLPSGEVEVLFEGLSEDIRNTSLGSGIVKKLESTKRTAIGSKAPDFTAPTPSGEQLALNQVLGKVTLVDFWAAWCRPCRAENPNVVRVYEKYKDKGLSILGVSLDRNASDWKKAIEDDGLTWHHVSNVRYFDEIAELYNVTAIPASFILDENGVIVAKNLRGDALEAKIAELLP